MRLAVISHSRPECVERMEALAGGPLTWAVPSTQTDDYHEAGAQLLLPYEYERFPDACGVRNALLDAYLPDGPVLITDDDCRQLRWWDGSEMSNVTLAWVADYVLGRMDLTNVHLGGISNAANPFWTKNGPAWRTTGFLKWLFVVDRTTLRFDPGTEASEDYDYVLQHHVVYGAIAQADHVYGDYKEKTNGGGYQVLPTEERLEMQRHARKVVRGKFPQYVTWPHPKHGPDELAVNWKLAAR